MRAKTDEQKLLIHRQFKKYRNHINKLCRTSKAHYYNKYFTDNKSNLLKVWEGVKQMINTCKKMKNQVSCIRNENNIITDPK